mgnify:CR=1 FL=1
MWAQPTYSEVKVKKIILGLATLSTVSAFAGITGLPSEDPIVKNLRTRFEQAKSPTSEDLLNKTFVCKVRRATKGDFSSDNSNLSFLAHDGMYIQASQSKKTNNMLMVDNGKEVIGVTAFDNYVGYEAIRVTENGDLISEWSVTKDRPSEQLAPLADAGEGTAVISYTVCVEKR